MRTRMMRWLLRLTVGLVAIIALTAIAVYGISELRLRKTYQVEVAELFIPTDAASIERGRILAGPAAHCAGCHMPNLGGQVMVDDLPFLVAAPNLTSGAGGVGATYSNGDLLRAIRHGVRPDGSTIQLMPAQNYNQLSDQDVAAIIAYIRSMPPVDNQPGETELRPLGRLLMVLGQFGLPAESIDHTVTSSAAVPFGRTVAYGQYLAVIGNCASCHGANYSGAPLIIPGEPPSANLTPGGGLSDWSEADFVTAMRAGVRPDGSAIDPAMPWELTGQLSDDELGALYLYFKTLPALEYNSPAE
ncbi:MAG: cytochrome c [Roseiflexaceae bacterium]|nr:cytochrome c [Roseiflexaceae bacterium]